jgi:hypothetical protein
MVFPKHFYLSGLYLFWNVGEENCILKYFENIMIDHSRKWLIFPRKYIQVLSISRKMADYLHFHCSFYKKYNPYFLV